LSDIVEDGVTGFLVPPAVVQARHGRLLELVQDASMRRSMGAAAERRAAERFDAGVNASRLVDLAVAAATR
jgi:glycosyltransferase involved in cell wall biosynthesis